MTEIRFEQHWKNFALAFAVVLGWEIIFFPIQIKLWRKGDYLGILLINSIALTFLIGFIYPFIFSRQLVFYEEGISFIHLFQRKFVKWEDFEQVGNISVNRHQIFLLKSPAGKVKIHLSQFNEKEKFVAFLSSKLTRLVGDKSLWEI